ncbi:restriction endonuclease subunit S [Altericroceibacterium endophyticum]|uniref:Restriction endonuclease subunit S n=1 Tax=Altericroceibacterium endophyticum TaxID=1808508 RepID=A0A6I4T3C3_9SPHN|nr:restriction endonuclease subunit S [Altericroceibacterium endophyticum]MXO65298.1 restriction endonuclease subunit S [Altericroceibacterium endophyticum]
MTQTANRLPQDWETVPLGEHYHFQNGVNADAQAYGRGIPFANVLEVITRTHLRVDDIPGRVTLSRDSVKAYAIRRGDVLFNRTSETHEEVGLASVYSDDAAAVFGGFVIRGRPKTETFDPTFSGYAFRAPNVRAQIVAKGQGAVRANIGQSELKSVLVPRPKPHEQRAIAAALSDADALIEGLESLIAKKRAIKQGAMQELLTGRQRLAGFSNEWPVKRLADLATFHKGKGLPKSALATFGAHPCIHYGELFTKYGAEIGEIFSSTNDVSDPFLAMKNDVLMPTSDVTPRGLAKASALFQDNVVAGGDILVIRPADLVLHGPFLSNMIRHDEEQVLKLVTGTTVFHLYASDMMNFEMPVPELSEQRAIASTLSDMGKELSALEIRLAKARQIKQGMMQELLTGRIRLI